MTDVLPSVTGTGAVDPSLPLGDVLSDAPGRGPGTPGALAIPAAPAPLDVPARESGGWGLLAVPLIVCLALFVVTWLS